jgi:DNA replication and repair protein RecF
MPIIRLDITDFRNIVSAKCEPIPDGFNLIYGDNGSGKTSLLESIYYLGLGRSFRSANSAHIVNNLASKFAIYSQVRTSIDQFVSVGLERHQDGSLGLRMAGKEASSVAEIASLLPIQLINSNCYNLLDAGPGFRRKYLDWGAFHHSPDFIRIWRQFRRILKQRNAALTKRVSKKELNAWNDEIVLAAYQLHEIRDDYVRQLLPILKQMVAELLTISDLNIEYYPGWNMDENYHDALNRSLDRDFQLGRTQLGPHRANFNITINRLPAKDILSRGQQKLFCSKNKRPIYLVDDLPSELDMTSRTNLVTLLSKQDAQIFVTAVELGIFDSCPVSKPVKLFHVEHGNLKQVGF